MVDPCRHSRPRRRLRGAVVNCSRRHAPGCGKMTRTWAPLSRGAADRPGRRRAGGLTTAACGRPWSEAGGLITPGRGRLQCWAGGQITVSRGWQGCGADQNGALLLCEAGGLATAGRDRQRPRCATGRLGTAAPDRPLCGADGLTTSARGRPRGAGRVMTAARCRPRCGAGVTIRYAAAVWGWLGGATIAACGKGWRTDHSCARPAAVWG